MIILNITKKNISRKLFITNLIIVALAITGFVFLYINQTAGATVTGWMAGRIIDDSVFTNKSSMTVSQIQSFLNSKVPTCDTNGTKPASDYGRPDLTHAQYAASRGWQAPPYICLKNYNQSGKSAAQIIYDKAQAYSINPRVLIVLLQKEQALVTDTWPLDTQYRSATGYGCPDTAVCNSLYYGFSNQVTWAATMFRAIMNNSPTWYTPYEVGSNYIQYNPNESCGGSNVYIQNRATQALYNYTPYQPNQAALNADWGSAPCGAYGNRNFYLYYTKWFGATTSAATYGYSVMSQEFYSDYEYKNKLTTPLTIQHDQKIYVKLIIKNIGNQAWYSDNLRVGTLNAKDRSSIFYASAVDGSGYWPKPNRLPAISGDSDGAINGGETATFMFQMKAPPHLGSYNESFGLVLEGYRWLNNTFTIPITVVSSSPYYYVQKMSFDAYSNSSMTKKLDVSKISLYTDSKIYIKATIKNTGNQTLPTEITKIATTNPQDRTSIYRDATWLSQNRATAEDNGDILPQSTGTFSFSITAPNTPQIRASEQFGLVIESQRWLSDNIGIISVQTNQRPPSILNTNQSLRSGNLLLSGDERFKFVLQSDGNLVLYSPTRAIWSSHTMGKGGIELVMQSDGNLVLYTENWLAIWSSRTEKKGESSLHVQNDGNLVIYGAHGYTWSSQTNGLN